MALTAKNIIDRASMIIQDLTNVRWPLSELVNWINDARREIAVVRPDIYSEVKSDFSCTSGAKQTLPTGGLRLMDVPRNASGPAITVTNRGFLDQQNPSWQQMTGSSTIKHFMIDERNPSTFWVYPPASGATLEIIYQKAPTDITEANYATASLPATGGLLTAYEELYGGAMVDYICYRAFSKDSEYAGNAERAIAHYNQFLNSLRTGGVVNIASSPNVQNVGGTKQVPQG